MKQNEKSLYSKPDPGKKQLNNRMHALRAFYCHELKKAMAESDMIPLK